VFATDVDVRINRTAIAGLTMPGGEVWSWCDRKARPAMVQGAKAAAPVRTGRLKRSIRGEMRKVNQNSCDIFLAAGGRRAYYAGYVHEGTHSFITASDPAKMMILYQNDTQVGGSRLPDAIAGGHGDSYLHKISFVAGQKANPFLTTGGRAGLRTLGVTV
jgi:hypothetical protein